MFPELSVYLKSNGLNATTATGAVWPTKEMSAFQLSRVMTADTGKDELNALAVAI